jgi:hypothetical protein
MKLQQYIKSLFVFLVCMVSMASAQNDPTAKLNLTLVAPQQATAIDDIIEVQLMVSAENNPQRFVVADVPFGWDPTRLQLLGVSLVGSHVGVMQGYSTFPVNDYTWCNEVVPPQDGNGMFYCYGVLGYEWIVTTEPAQMCKFIFKVVGLGRSDVVLYDNLPLRPTLPASCVVYGCCVGGNDVTGSLTNTTVGLALQGDFNNDGLVNAQDMGELLADWGAASFKPNPHDINNDGIVNSQDLALLVNNWS